MVRNGRQGDGSVYSRAFLVCHFRILFDHFKNICPIKPSACLAELILILRNLDLIVNSNFFFLLAKYFTKYSLYQKNFGEPGPGDAWKL